MKQYFLFFILVVALASCDIRRRNRMSDDSNMAFDKAMKDTTTVRMIDSSFNFGTIIEGEKVEYNFRFINTGKKYLAIESAHASCGCTIAQKPDGLILPGDTSFIKVVFNSFGKSGHNLKHITVLSNAYPSFPVLTLTGEVTAKTLTD
jgi:hypothetical protein